MGKRIACLGDGSDHNGTLTTTNQDDKTVGKTLKICVEGCQHKCPVQGHGTTSVTAVTTKSYINNKLIITEGSVAGCGAVMTPPDRKVYVE